MKCYFAMILISSYIKFEINICTGKYVIYIAYCQLDQLAFSAIL